jgi:hypothetical protein
VLFSDYSNVHKVNVFHFFFFDVECEIGDSYIKVIENPPPQFVLSPETHVTPTNINIVPCDICSIDVTYPIGGKNKHKERLVVQHILHNITSTTTTFLTHKAISNPTTRNIHNHKNGQHSHS